MPQPASVVLAFDLFGTLLDTNSIATTLQQHLSVSAERALEISVVWRKYQLEYTWRLNSMGQYQSFDEVTRRSLLNAALEFGFDLSPSTVSAICEAYHTLEVFPETLEVMQTLNSLPYIHVVMFSNGTDEMISSALAAASLAPYTKTHFVADTVRRYKPAPEIYQGLLEFLGRSATPSDVWLVSSNALDVVGARSVGFNALYIDRTGKGWEDRLVDTGPTTIIGSLKDIPTVMQAVVEQ